MESTGSRRIDAAILGARVHTGAARAEPRRPRSAGFGHDRPLDMSPLARAGSGDNVGDFGADVPAGGGRIALRLPANAMLILEKT